MMKLVAAFLLGFWLYFGTFFGASPTFAAVSESQLADRVETVKNKNLFMELAFDNFLRNDCPEITSECSHSMDMMDMMHGMQGRSDIHGIFGKGKNSEFKNRPVLTKVQQFLISIPRDYYTISNIDKLKTLVQRKQALLIDVRESREYAAGYIKGAINIPLQDLSQNLNQIPQNRLVILYCSTGYRAAMGVMALQMLGYRNVKGFPPSFEGWKAAGEEIATLGVSPESVEKFN